MKGGTQKDPVVPGKVLAIVGEYVFIGPKSMLHTNILVCAYSAPRSNTEADICKQKRTTLQSKPFAPSQGQSCLGKVEILTFLVMVVTGLQ